MEPATEVVIITLKSSDDGEAVAQVLNKTVLSQPGCLRTRWSLTTEDSTQGRLFVDWEDVSFHQQFIASPGYKEFVQGFESYLTVRPGVHHVHFNPPLPPPVLSGSSPVVELLYIHFPSDGSLTKEIKDKAEKDTSDCLAAALADAKGATGETTIGWTLETVEFKDEQYFAMVVCIGWTSVEAHHEFRTTEAFEKHIPKLRGLHGSKGGAVVHISPILTERPS